MHCAVFVGRRDDLAGGVVRLALGIAAGGSGGAVGVKGGDSHAVVIDDVAAGLVGAEVVGGLLNHAVGVVDVDRASITM